MGNTWMKTSKINLLHRTLEDAIRRVLKFAKLKITQPHADGDWSKASVGSQVVFELLYAGTHEEHTADRDRGGRCSVFALHPNYAGDALSSRYWVSWFEDWRVKEAKKEWALCTAGWSVFVGPPNQQKQQLIRAEWDQLPIAGSPHTGQPHWHVDRFPRLDTAAYDSAAVAVPNEPSLVLANAADGTSELAGLHLAMGTWNEGLDHPQCWQRSVRIPDDAVAWAVRTLKYLQSELPAEP